MGPQQIGLQGNAVTVAAGHLEHRFDAGLQQQATEGQAAHPHHCPAAIGHIDGVDPAPKQGCHLHGPGGVTATGWSDFRGKREFASLQCVLEQHKPLSPLAAHHAAQACLE
jgi:hypothetical protein